MIDVDALIADLKGMARNYETEGEANTDPSMKYYLLGKADGVSRTIDEIGRAHFAATGEVVL